MRVKIGFLTYFFPIAYAVLLFFLAMYEDDCSITGAFSKERQIQHSQSRIAEARIAYSHHHGHFPPAVIYDTKGVPLHSWRVLILPFLKNDLLYRKFHLEQPWDSPENLAL